MKNILFITDNNIATRLLVENTMGVARDKCYPIQISVMCEKDGIEHLRVSPCGLTLLSPSIRFYLNDRKNKGLPEDAKIVVVDSNIYGAANGAALLDVIIKNFTFSPSAL